VTYHPQLVLGGKFKAEYPGQGQKAMPLIIPTAPNKPPVGASSGGSGDGVGFGVDVDDFMLDSSASKRSFG
jgi:hypothetical protein